MHQIDLPTSFTQNDPPTSVTQNDPPTNVTQNKVYKHHGSLHHHMKRMHKSNRPQTTGSETILCKEAECSFHCRDLAQLRQYLSLEHGIEMMTDSSLELKAKEKLL